MRVPKPKISAGLLAAKKRRAQSLAFILVAFIVGVFLLTLVKLSQLG
ncbi:MAG: hypothetical protein ACR2N8_01520 [Parvibaculales bacterium]